MKVLTRRFEWLGNALPNDENTEDANSATQTVNNGYLQLAMTNDSEAQIAGWNLGDANPFLATRVLRARFWIEKVVDFDHANCRLYFGLGTNHNVDIAAIAEHVAFGINGNNDDLIVRAQDGTNTLAETEIGITFEAGETRKFEINLADGLHANSPPVAQEGGRARCGFYLTNLFGEARKINLGAARANISAYNDGLQPFCFVRKADLTGVGTVRLHRVEVDWLAPN